MYYLNVTSPGSDTVTDIDLAQFHLYNFDIKSSSTHQNPLLDMMEFRFSHLGPMHRGIFAVYSTV